MPHICEYCHNHLADTYDTDGYPVCNFCIEESFYYCAECGELCHNDDAYERWDSLFICGTCADDKVICDYCGTLCDSHECPSCKVWNDEDEYNFNNPRS